MKKILLGASIIALTVATGVFAEGMPAQSGSDQTQQVGQTNSATTDTATQPVGAKDAKDKADQSSQNQNDTTMQKPAASDSSDAQPANSNSSGY